MKDEGEHAVIAPGSLRISSYDPTRGRQPPRSQAAYDKDSCDGKPLSRMGPRARRLPVPTNAEGGAILRPASVHYGDGPES